MTKLRGRRSKLIIIGLLLLLACAPLDRLQGLDQNSRAVATGVALVNQGDYPALAAYQRLNRLPGYQLEQRITRHTGPQQNSSLSSITQRDAEGNLHTVLPLPSGEPFELYQIGQHRYVFSKKYGGWVDTTTRTSTDLEEIGLGYALGGWPAADTLFPLLTQTGAVPIWAGEETVQERPAIRYQLNYLSVALKQAAQRSPGGADAALQGMLWVDDQTGALLKMEILLYQNGRSQPSQEFLVEISQIGQVELIQPPAPIINPEAVAAATATAQAWSVLQATLTYQDQTLAFELTPVQVVQTEQQSPPQAQMSLVLRELPVELLAEANAETFLETLQAHLSLSIPQNNQIIASKDFQLETIDAPNRSMNVSYFFEANLDTFDQVELILSNPGNPLFATVAVVSEP